MKHYEKGGENRRNKRGRGIQTESADRGKALQIDDFGPPKHREQSDERRF